MYKINDHMDEGLEWPDKPSADWYAYISIEASKYYGANAQFFNKTARIG